MTDEKPTGTESAGASIAERLEERFGNGQQTESEATGQEAAPNPAETTAEVPASDAQTETEGPQYELADVAQIMGLDAELLDVDEDGALLLKTKIDGKDGTAKLQDLVKSYQLQGHVDAKVRHVAEQEKQLGERVVYLEQFAQTKHQELENLLQAANHMLAQEFHGLDWDQLLQNDPLDYQAKRHSWEKRSAQIQQLGQAFNQHRQQIAQAMDQKRGEDFMRQMQRLPGLTDWKDAKSVETGLSEMAKWLSDKGANLQLGLADAVTLSLLRSAMLVEQKAPKVAAAEQKVRAAPKLVRPGQGTDKAQRQSESVRGLKEQIKKSGGKSGIAEYLIATGRA